MKKIVMLIMPMLVIISIVFYIRNKDFDSHNFLNFVSSLRFSNAFEQLTVIRDLWSESLQNFEHIIKPKNPVDFLSAIVEAVIYIFRLIYNISVTIFDLIKDLIVNVGSIYNWLFA